MNKKTILIIAICAIVVIAGSVVGVALLRNSGSSDDVTTTTAPQTEYVFEEHTYQTPEPITNEATTDTSNNLLTTLKNVVNTTKKVVSNNKNNKVTTTKKNTTTTTKKVVDDHHGIVDEAIGENGNQFLGYRYNTAGKYYYTDDKDCWQMNAGYNEVYDNMAAAAAMYIDQVRIRFTYENKDWMIQLWKGQYGFLLVGAEIGVYTAPSGTYTGEVGSVNHYNCADKEDWLKMEMTCYWRKNNKGSYVEAFSREYTEYWWATGFVKGQLTKYSKPRTELKLKARITFKSTEMANLFVQGMRESGFGRAVGADQLVDDSFYQNGKDVWFLWSTKYHDCFVGYEGRD